jgi:hypothetical protein
MNNDLTIRKKNYAAAKEIKASAHYAYIVNGITLDGSKFNVNEYVPEGQCLVKDNTTGKYEKYADTDPAKASITGTAAVTPADCSAINKDTKLEITVNGSVYTVTNAVLKTITAETTEAQVVAMLGNAVNPDGIKLSTVADLVLDEDEILTVATKLADASASLYIKGTWGAAGDEATIEGVLGISDGSLAYEAGTFPVGKSNPVILDESIQFKAKDDGTNPDLTAGQVLVHGAVYTSMLVGVTTEFKKAMGGAMRFVD